MGGWWGQVKIVGGKLIANLGCPPDKLLSLAYFYHWSLRRTKSTIISWAGSNLTTKHWSTYNLFWWQSEWLFKHISFRSLLAARNSTSIRPVSVRLAGGVILTLQPAQEIIEPRHDKTNKMAVRPAKTQISLGIRPVWSESSLCAEWVGKAFFLRTMKTLIRLGGCPGWSESSLGAHSFCWFCHVVAQLLLHTTSFSVSKQPCFNWQKNI